jgi:iron complex outermembrane receptor protein
MTYLSENFRSRHLLAGILGTVSMLALAPSSVIAATGAGAEAGLEEITVTATKRGDQALMSVPITIQAISGNTLKAMGAAEFADFATSVPSLQFQDLGPGDKKYIIRGINSSGAATVGVYYDEAVITADNKNDGGGRNADIRLYDIDHIEVLKGPQGTLYGASSMTGTIRFITKKPDLKNFEGYVEGDVSTTKNGAANYRVNGMLNLPVVEDKLALRTVGWIVDDSGYIDAVRIPSGPLNNINNDGTQGGRIQAAFKVSEELLLTAGVTYQRTNSNGSSRYTPAGTMSFGTTGGTNFSGGTGFPAVPGGDLINTDLTQSPWHENLQVYSLTAEYNGSIGNITATSNYFKRNIDFNFDSSPILFFFGVPVPAVTYEPQSRSIWSNELRYASKFEGPVNVVIGGSYQHEKSDLTVQVIKSNALGLINGPFSPLNADDALSSPTGNTFFGRTDQNTLKQEALFGEVTFAATDKLQAVVGARYFHSSIHGLQETTHPFGGFSGSPVGPLPNDSSDSKATFKFNLSYKATPDFLLYATAAQGFRVGGVNAANLPFASNIPRSYKPDSLWSYEVGSKGTFLDKRLQVTAAAYEIRWKDMQVQAVDNTGAFHFITNAGKAKVDGFELELNALLTQGLTLTAAGSYQNSRLTQDQPTIPGNLCTGHAGDKMFNVPKWQGDAALSYSAPVSGDFTGTLRSDVVYRGRTDTQFNGCSFNVGLPSYALVNLRASIENKAWTATLYVRNLTDKRAVIDAISSDQDPLGVITVRPRTLGASITRRF